MTINVLIVDDSRTVRRVMEKALRVSGIPVDDVLQAGDGNEALSVLGQSTVDLVLTDLNMPGMGGRELLQRMQGDAKLKAIPIVVVSTEGNSSRVEELMEGGASGFLRKPTSPESVAALIREILPGAANA